ncbi:hypothetical protein ACFFGH_13930 [Lysobacter korlensis]|uniref:AsmA domain-containing protein n=1 Tax=Lysobacter korlensis TaxID=553636 RepID=A0ABV6RPN6_9GAMM
MSRRRRLLLVVAVLLVLLAGAVHWASRPQRLTGALVDRIGNALGLEINASGISEYRLRGGPRLVVRDLVARQPGASDPLLSARRIALSLPWSTVQARGGDLTADRVEIDGPVLDLQALRRWQATRPPSGEIRVPTLTDGLQVRSGQLVGDGWRVRDIALDLPRLHPQRPVRGNLEGRIETDALRVPFDLAIALSQPARDASAEARGTVAVQSRDWQLPMQVQAAGQLRLDARVPGIDGLKLGADAQHRSGSSTTPFVFGLAGNLRFAQAGVSLQPAGVALRGTGAVPQLDAGGRIEWKSGLGLDLQGALARWPQAWPALPAPIGKPQTPVPFALAYNGPGDLSGATSLQLEHRATTIDTDFRLPLILDWLEHRDQGSPLPPLTGRMQTPEMQIAGATLEGVEIEIEAPDAPASDAADGTATDDD